MLKTPLAALALLLVVPAAHAQDTSCADGTADAYLDVNNVRARIVNTGGLFWRGDPGVYEVPQGGGANAAFLTTFAMGGLVEGEVRTAATTYGPWEFWPGPLDEEGRPPDDCTPYDRIAEITAADLRQYDETGFVSPRLRDWPYHLGAPVIDGDGIPDNYNLAGGDRPEVLGHQTLWWIMNDAAGEHRRSKTAPLHVEVQVSAFAAQASADAIDDATFYRYRITYRGAAPLDSAYVGLLADTDLGDYDDDYVGSDSLLGLGYTYNADDDDLHYGTAPPAFGFDFVQGPRADADGLDNNHDGRVDEPGEQLQMTAFVMYRDDGALVGSPRDGAGFYAYLKGRWLDGRPITYGGDGVTFSDVPTTFMLSGDPATRSYWSEVNVDGDGTANTPFDRRFSMSMGPFSMQPGETIDVVVAAVWARGTDHLDAVTELRTASRTVQASWDDGFQPSAAGLPAPPAGAAVLLSPGDGASAQPTNATLQWQPVPGATSYHVDLATEPNFDRPGPHLQTFEVEGDHAYRLSLEADRRYYWRVLPANDGGYGAWSEVYTFTTSTTSFDYLPTGFTAFLTTANAAGPLDPPTGAAAAEAGFPVSEPPDARQQVGDGVWVLHRHLTSEAADYETFTNRITRSGLDWYKIVPYDYELRFTERGGKAYMDSNGEDPPEQRLIDVPFELWRTGIGTPDDPSDDVRMIPYVHDLEPPPPPGETPGTSGRFGLRRTSAYYPYPQPSHPVSPGADDPPTDPFSWMLPLDDTPGEHGYEAWVAESERLIEEGGDPRSALTNHVVLSMMVLVNVDGGDVGQGIYDQALPETGTVFRIVTAKPAVPVLAAPADGAPADAASLTLGWHGQATRLQVALDPNFEHPIVDLDDLPSVSTYTVSDLEHGSTYFWRAGTALAWSEPWRFVARTDVATENAGTLPEHLTIATAYPNPFAERTTLRVGVPEAGAVTVRIYDLLGRHVATVADGRRGAGWHAISWQADGLASGTYFAEVTTATGARAVRMLTLVR